MQRHLARYTAGMSESKASRGLGFWMCLALVIGNMIGSGVFLLPASLAPYGVNSILGWLVTAAGSVLLAIVFARLARSYPDAAGPYVYPRKAFGEAAGFLTAWGYWMAVWVGNAAIVTGTVAYLAELVPAIKQTVGGPAIVSCAIIWILTLPQLARRAADGCRPDRHHRAQGDAVAGDRRARDRAARPRATRRSFASIRSR